MKSLNVEEETPFAVVLLDPLCGPREERLGRLVSVLVEVGEVVPPLGEASFLGEHGVGEQGGGGEAIRLQVLGKQAGGFGEHAAEKVGTVVSRIEPGEMIIGAGSEAAAAITVLKQIRPEIEIIAVQAEGSPAAYLSWKAGKIVTAPNTTFAGGVATGTAYEVPFGLYKDALADFVLLTEAELYEGIALAAHHTRNLTEGAGSACLRAAFKIRDHLSGKKVAIQMSGGNASGEELRKAISLPGLLDGTCQD